ncbi:MAG TPA: GTPase HflX [Bdellovibrionales bacterium]|nr:GTPase HflX [Bdellovibrionales bacterium]
MRVSNEGESAIGASILKNQERVIVVGVGLKSDSFVDLKQSLAELEELAIAAGGEVVGSLTQVLPEYKPATLIGSGKVEEIKELVTEAAATVVIVDHQLSGIQTRNLEKEWNVRVLDRNQVILDIFAMRAQTYEGKLQVELAQMLDQLPRMVDAWMGSLSRQGGGIGTRGPGETALEMDRRRIRDRVKVIKKQLETVRANRSQHRNSRKRNKIPSFALIGYTNTGKSTLLNKLTHSQVLAKDQVFATLDPTTRKVHLPDTSGAVMTDTVGFIRKLPPQLIEAFKATLEESAEADILVHVVDLSSNQMQTQMEVVSQLIKEFGWDSKPVITVFNKIDQAPFERQFQVKAFPRVFVSAQTGEGIDRLKRVMTEAVQALQQEVELFFPKSQEHRIFDLGRETQITRKESASSGTICAAHMTPSLLSRWKEFLVTAESVG